MRRTNAIPIREMLHDFYKENPQVRQKMLEARIKRAWGDIAGPMIMRATQNLFVINRVLHVSLSSSVVRNELLLHRKRLLTNLNEQAGEEVIDNIVIR